MKRLFFKANKQKMMLSEAVRLSNTTQKKFSEVNNISLRAFEAWKYEESTLPKYIFKNLIERYPSLIKYGKYIIREVESNWGQVKGGINRVSKLNYTEIKNEMKRLHEIKRRKAKKVKHINKFRIISRFSLRVKKLSLNPLNFIGVMLLTDGNVYFDKNYYNISYASKSKKLTQIFIELVKLWKENIVLGYYITKHGVVISYFGLPAKNDIISLSPSFKKAPRKETVEEYLSYPQPSLMFIKKSDYNTKLLSIRLALSTEGSISFIINKNKSNIKIYPILFLSCAHPKLCTDWIKIFSDIGIKMQINRSKKKWSGINGMRTSNITDIKKFMRLGGFISGVITSKKSKYFYNIEKNKVLSLLLKKQEFKNMKELMNIIRSPSSSANWF